MGEMQPDACEKSKANQFQVSGPSTGRATHAGAQAYDTTAINEVEMPATLSPTLRNAIALANP